MTNLLPARIAARTAARQQTLAPIAMFVYNRPQHTRKTIEALLCNHLAGASDLFIFSDGSKNELAAAGVREVRQLIHNISAFRSVTITESERNLGLANSVIAGVTQICETFGRAIVMEDDLVTTSDFLTFLNSALDTYASERRIFSISGFNYAVKAPQDYRFDAFSSYRSCSWGWATWVDRWKLADWQVTDYEEFRKNRARQRLFERGGEDLTRMLKLQMAGKLDSWAIRWAYTHFRLNGLSLLASTAKVRNIGLDGSGIHSRRGSARQSQLIETSNASYRFPSIVEPDPRFTAGVRKMCCRSLPRKVAHFLWDPFKPLRDGRWKVAERQPIVPSKTLLGER